MIPAKGRYVFSSESVTEGHPDKVADQISDAILDTLLEQDPNSHVACETLVTTGMAIIAGEISTKGYADIGLFHAAHIPAETVLVQLLVGLHIPEAAGVGADFVGQDDGAVAEAASSVPSWTKGMMRQGSATPTGRKSRR